MFVWIGFAYVMRWTTWVDRRLAGWLRRESVPADYRRQSERGFMPFLKTITIDPQTWRDFGWLALNSVVGFALGLAALTAAGIALAYITLPIWYWAIQDPHAQYGVTNLGLFTVDTLGKAFAATGIGLVLTPLVMLLARGAAAGHAARAARVLGTPRS